MVHRRNWIALISICAIASIGGRCSDRKPQVSQDLLAAFSSGCSSYGSWSQQAIAQTSALVSVLENLKNRDACAPLEQSLKLIAALQPNLRQFSSGSGYHDYRVADRAVDELSKLAIESPGDEVLVAALTEARVNRALMKARVPTEIFESATVQLGNSLQTLALSARDLSACLKQSPAAGVELATNAMALGASFFGPVIGATAAMAGQLINGAVEFIRGQADEDTIWKLYRSQMPTALTCGLEAMTNTFCEANDAVALLKLSAKGYRGPSELPNDFWRGIDLLNRRLSVLQKWILKIKSGVPPQDLGDAGRTASAWKQVFDLELTDIQFQGGYNWAFRQISNSSDEETRRGYIRDMLVQFISQVIPTGCEGCSGLNPFHDFEKAKHTWACYLVLGPTETNAQTCPVPEAEESLETYISNRLLNNADILKIPGNWSAVMSRVANRVNLNFSQQVSLSPQVVLDQAFFPRYNSPRQILGLVLDFVHASKKRIEESSARAPYRLELLKLVEIRISEILEILDTPSDPENQPQNKVAVLFEKLDIRRSSRQFVDQINYLIAADVEDRMRDGEFPEDATEVLRAAGMDVRDRLQNSGVYLDDAMEDLNNARAHTMQALEIFRTHFKKSFGRAVVDLHELGQKKGKASPEERRGVDRPSGQTVGKLCALMLSVGAEFPDEKSKAICMAASLESIYASRQTLQKDPLRLRIFEMSKDLVHQSFKKRVCGYYNFKRRERLAEILERRVH